MTHESSHETPTQKSGSKLKEFALPFSIIIAGILIAGAVVLTRSADTVRTAGPTKAQVLSDLTKAASSLGINKDEFIACIDGESSQKIAEDVQQATDAKMQGTPYFIIEFGPFENPSNVIAVPGAISREVFDDILARKDVPTGLTPVPIPPYVRPTTNDHVRGDLAQSEVRIIEYADIDCPFCKKVYPVVADIQSSETNVAWIYRHYPLTRLHPYAYLKAQGTECVAQLGGESLFWKYLDKLQ